MSELSYKEALAELEKIVRLLETGKLDVDEAAREVKRGHDLVEMCRVKITAAKLQVKEVNLPDEKNNQ